MTETSNLTVGLAPAVAVPAVAAPAPAPAAARPAAGRADAPMRTADRPAERPVAAPAAVPRLVLDDLLMHVVSSGGSDLHLTSGAPPTVRVRGSMVQVEGYDELTPEQLQSALYGVMTERQRKVFEENLELDFAYAVPGKARFRVNVFQQRESLGAVMRLIPWEIKPLESLGMPSVMGTFAGLKRGLVLVTGPTGSGKSTTLAAIIDQANRMRSGHIMTIEDPIEFLHGHQSSLVNQREVGSDTHSFRAALKHVLRQDPDVILVGELRDLDTISVALTAAETGHLVFATLHTQSAQDTITRIVDVFPAEQQQQVRTQLAATLQAVVCQTLCKTIDGTSRVAAVEIMICNAGIRAMIRDDKLQQIQGTLQAGAKDGMQTLNAHLAQLVKAGRISYETGLDNCSNRADFDTLVGSGARRPSAQSWH
ncbi:type IV pilus twitching motility protein PilT [Kribbella sp. NPDC023972]|uniref:type IV pilus twitching motility protein PilT n=1 Tax=Kribbella sp. NPDC023972 TaxID=3154795 RepID=UPI0033FF0B17